MFQFLTATDTAAAEVAGGGNGFGILAYYVVMIGGVMLLFYFMAVRPQKKQQRKQEELMASIAIGDSVLTTAGFYGVVIDIVNEEVIIVEFGSNKNCRIPMKKHAIVEVEKPEIEDTKKKEKE
ncbi:MAG: preprotein translocase subunit YajC [Lachnospiraceae bacterium]|nr:preprotein translocase subunit YajC [Lachnospiraceae bacterium]